MTTLRLAHLSDLHCDERRDLDDWRRVMMAFVKQARERYVDLVLISGDFFERKSSPAERNAMADVLLEIAEAVAPVYGVRGNHDAEGDLEIFNRLEAQLSFIEIFERPTAEPNSAIEYLPKRCQLNDPGIAILTLPWFSKQHLVARMPADADQATTNEMAIGSARQLLSLIGAEARRCRDRGMIPLLIGHVQVAGSEVSTGQTLIGTTVELSPGDLRDVGCEYVALGHIHKRQDWYDGQVAYAGSPLRMNFGETEAKGWNLVTFEDGKFAGVEFVELPARRIVLIERDWTSGPDADGRFEFGEMEHDIKPGALVRFRYRIRPRHLHFVDEDAIRRLFELHQAATIQIEAILVHETAVRCAEISEATSTAAKLDAYLDAKGHDDAEQRERLHGLLEGLEAPETTEVMG